MTSKSHQVSWPVRVDPSGETGPTRAQARGPGWRTTSRGLIVPAHIDADRPEQRICEAGALLPALGGVTGWAALRWLGGIWFAGLLGDGERQPVTLAIPGKSIAARREVLLSQERLGRDEIHTIDGLRLVLPARAVAFEARYASTLWTAVEVIDMAAYSDLVSVRDLLTLISNMNGWTGIERLRRAAVLADENSWSPRETWLRLVWLLLAGLDRPLCNAPVFDLHGRLLGTPDLLDPVTGLVGEYDGEQHLETAQRRQDLARHDGFRDVGLEVVVVMAGETGDDAARRLEAAQRRAVRRTEAGRGRGWTLEAPPWWVRTHTVQLRRGLEPFERGRWLRYRRDLP